MATGPMRFGEDNNAGSTPPTQTVLRSDSNDATLKVANEETTGPTGGGLEVVGGSFGVKATGFGTDSPDEGIGVNGIGFAIGVNGEALSNGVGVRGEGESGVVGISVGSGDGVAGRSPQRNGVQGESFNQSASGVYGQNFSGGGFGVAGRSNAQGVPPGAQGWGAGVFGDNTGGWAGLFNGWVLVTGSLSVLGDIFHSGSGLRIDNPVDPANSYLNHCFVQSPDMMNIYNGNVTTDADGTAVVELPSYFEALNQDFRYQLTVVGQFATAIVAEEVSGNRFRINTDKPNVTVSWQVTGIRQDAWANAHRTEVEVQKPDGERGKYLNPREHGQQSTAGIYYVPPTMSEEERDSGDREPKVAADTPGRK